MNKRQLILITIAVILIIGTGIGYYLTSQTAPTVVQTQETQVVSPTPAGFGSGGTEQTASNVHINPSATPEEIAKGFYDWYMNYPRDVVATGAYKTSPYLTAQFISNIDGFAQNYNPKFDPIFCTPNKTKSYAVQPVVATDTPNKVTVQITDRNVDARKPLYNMVLISQNGSWRIDDIICQ